MNLIGVFLLFVPRILLNYCGNRRESIEKLINGSSSLLFIFSGLKSFGVCNTKIRTEFIGTKYTEDRITNSLTNYEKLEGISNSTNVRSSILQTLKYLSFYPIVQPQNEFSLVVCKEQINVYWGSTFQIILLWKVLNTSLIFISFLCNANEYREPYLFYDHLNILFIGLTYICFSFSYTGYYEKIHPYLVPIILFISINEYIKYNSINFSKNITVVLSSLKSIFYYYYLYKNNFCSIDNLRRLLLSCIIGSIAYLIRYKLLIKLAITKRNNFGLHLDFVPWNFFIYKLLLTYIFHYCIMNILYIASISILGNYS